MIKKNWKNLNIYTGSLSQNVSGISCLSLNCSGGISVCPALHVSDGTLPFLLKPL